MRVVALSPGNDRLLGQRAIESIRRVCPGAESVTITGPHLLLQSVPEEVVKVLLRLKLL